MSDFANYLKSRRQAAGLSQQEVSAALGYTGPQFISNLERGISQLPITKISLVSDLYKIPKDELVEAVVGEYTRQLREKISESVST